MFRRSFEEGYFENSKKLESILVGSNFFYKQSPHLVPSLSKKKNFILTIIANLEEVNPPFTGFPIRVFEKGGPSKM